MPVKTDRFLDTLDFTLKWEGGFSNDPLDPGGATNFGIVQTEYDAFRKRLGLSLQSVELIERKEVLSIYQSNYWLAGDCDKLLQPLDLGHFDTCVNFGPFHAAKFLQQALSVEPDGSIGPQTLAAAASADPKTVASTICDERIAFRYERVKQRPDQKKFLQGWLNRDNALKQFCTK